MSFVVLALALTLGLNAITGFIPSWGVWYNAGANISHLQSLALLHGRLALFEAPYFPQADLVWRNGVHQVWGLGVPLMRLPFDALAWFFRASCFPDRILFLGAYFATAWFGFRSAWSSRRALGTSGLVPSAVAILMLTPTPLITVLKTRFFVYEETVAFGVLVVIALYFAVLNATQTKSTGRYATVSVLAGFLVLVRPPLAIYGLGAIALIAWQNRPDSRSRFLWLAGPFLGGLAFFFFFQVRQFGSMDPFAPHALNLSLNSLNTYFLKFRSAQSGQSLMEGVVELAGALFFNRSLNGFDFFQSDFFPGVSSAARFREFYFPFLTPLHAIIAGWALLAVPVALIASPKRRMDHPGLALWWGLSVFSLTTLSLFYAKTSALTSRYLLEFLPALSAAAALFLILAKDAVETWRLSRAAQSAAVLGLCAAFVGGSAVHAARARIAPSYEADPLMDPATKNFTSTDGLGALPPVSDSYTARTAASNFASKIQGQGWWPQTNGAVTASVQLFVSHAESVTLSLSPVDAGAGFEEAVRRIRLKVGRTEYRRGAEGKEAKDTTVTFLKPGALALDPGPHIVFIGFANPRDPLKSIPLRLNNVSSR